MKYKEDPDDNTENEIEAKKKLLASIQEETPYLTKEPKNMRDDELISLYARLKSNSTFYKKILQEDYRKKAKTQYRYEDAEAQLVKIREAGLKVRTEIDSRGLQLPNVGK